MCIRDRDGAESFEELYHRTGEFIEQVLRPQLEAGKNVLVVGHGLSLIHI